MSAVEQLKRPGVQRRDIDAIARRAVAQAISAGADSYQSDEAFWRQVRCVLGGGVYNEATVASECAIRLAKCKNFADALALRTLQAAANRRAA